MKLYSSVGPNPQVVRTFMAERGVTVDLVDIDLMGGENRKDDYLKINPAGQLPALVLADGTLITEITAICEYLDEISPGDSLIGNTPEERAVTRRWMRWTDFEVIDPMTRAFRYSEGIQLFQSRMPCFPDAAPGLKECVKEALRWLNGQMDGKTWLAGDRFTLADILLFSFVAFGGQVGQPLDRDLTNLAAWYDRMAERESVKA
ncbi:glutathione S-transferase family protein [Henriciella pelagia]|jgi:glutathione S-transferase|uniref:Glutathione S-transferase n=1 Tax=Henriciella pelagia TaxID=1977912 RepID=A0ABQ1J1H4_9PROT|nr:glutathione S-transferase family protein [Henriciella pelagia]GGB56554.1 glutathione S-transferase [Henriciella pelagia]